MLNIAQGNETVSSVAGICLTSLGLNDHTGHRGSVPRRKKRRERLRARTVIDGFLRIARRAVRHAGAMTVKLGKTFRGFPKFVWVLMDVVYNDCVVRHPKEFAVLSSKRVQGKCAQKIVATGKNRTKSKKSLRTMTV